MSIPLKPEVSEGVIYCGKTKRLSPEELEAFANRKPPRPPMTISEMVVCVLMVGFCLPFILPVLPFVALYYVYRFINGFTGNPQFPSLWR